MTQSQTTTISADTHLQGTLTFEGNAVVLGKVDGKITGSGEVSIGQQSTCQATIDAKTVIIDGTVEGNILAKVSVQLTSNARVNGDIFAQSIVIAPGATFQGKVRITSSGTSSNSEIETKSTPTESVTSTEADRPTPATSSTWTPAKPASLGAGLTGIGSSRASWPSQR